MSDFTYTHKFFSASSAKPAGSTEFKSTTRQLYISFTTNKGQDLEQYLTRWALDAEKKTPFTVKAKGSVDLDLTVNSVVIGSNYFVLDLETFYSYAEGEEVSFEFGLKAQQGSKPCGGFELFTVDDNGPTCTNGCVFKNTETNRRFTFSNVQKGVYEMNFEGPNQRYEIIWDTPSGDCDTDKIKILNRVDQDGTRARLEDYGNSDNADDINFDDLYITLTHGTYEWAGGDEDPIYYTTTQNGSLCPPGHTCSGGECVKAESTKLKYDDLLLLYDGEKETLFHVRAGDYMTRFTASNTIPVSRGGSTYETTVVNFDSLQPTDSISIYRPSDETVYKLTGEEYKNEFQYFGELKPSGFEVVLYNDKDPNRKGLAGETFVLEVKTEDLSAGTEYSVVTRIIGNLKPEFLNNKVSFLIEPNSGRVIGSHRAFGPGNIFDDTNIKYIQASSGAEAVLNGPSGSIGGSYNYGWTDILTYNATVTSGTDNGTAFQLPFVYPDGRIGELSGYGGAIESFTSSYESGFTMKVSEVDLLGNWGAAGKSKDSPLRFNEIDGTGTIFTSFYISDVNLKAKTVSGIWQKSGDPEEDQANHDSSVSQIQSRVNAEEPIYARFGSEQEHVGHHHINITPFLTPEVEMFTQNPNFSKIGNTKKFKFTISKNATLANEKVDTVYEKGAYIVCDVYASNELGRLGWRRTNYLNVLPKD